MTFRIVTATSFLAIAGFSAAPGFADVTAEQVWENWKVIGTVYGQTYTAGSINRVGDTLTLTDVVMDMASGNMKMAGTIPEVAFREVGDGTVAITMSDSYSMNMNAAGEIGRAAVKGRVTIGQNGLVMTASGTPEAINYDMAADSIVLSVADFTTDDEPHELDIDVTISNADMTYQVVPGDTVGITSTFAAQAARFQIAGKDDSGSGSVEAAGQMNALAGASSGAIPKAAAIGDLTKMLAQGYTTDGSFTYDAGNLAITSVDPNGSTTIVNSSSKGGSLNFSMDKDRIAYGLVGKSVALKAGGSAIPLPDLTAAYDEAAFSLLVPVSKSDEAKDFALQTRLQGLTVSDLIWSMVDPGASLPRDPATLIIDLKGRAKPLLDLLTADQSARMAVQPFALEALDVTALQLTVAGAEFKGDGALAFDHTQPNVLGGVAPMPTGKLNLSLTGATTLLGKLQTLGLVDPQITMTFGMFTGMLAKPGPTPDSFVAEVEFKEGGQILTNGNPLPF